MRVLHVVDISVPMLAGYTSRGRYIVTTQKELGHEPAVLSSCRQNADAAVEEEIDGIPYFRTPPMSRARSKLPVGLQEFAEIDHLRRRIVAVAQKFRPQIIHGHSSVMCGIPAYMAARQLGLPCVYEIRAFWEDAAVDQGKHLEGSLRYNAIRNAETRLAKAADGLIGICDGIKTDLMARGIDADRIVTVPNGVEVNRFTPQARNAALEAKFGFEGRTVVGYIGTFAPFEGVPYLVKALIRLMRQGRDDLRGLIVGAGPTYEECRRLAQDAGLEDRIVHPGKVDHSEVKQMYSLVDVLAYPRDRQRITELVTPLKPLEAMAMKKAVIGSDVGGLKELINDGQTGLLFPAEDVGALARQIERVVDDVALRTALGERGRTFVENERTWKRSIERHADLYRSAQEKWQSRGRLWSRVALLTGARVRGLGAG